MSIEKAQIVDAIRQEAKKEILFAYIFGSFVDHETYRDIDVALYLENPKGVDTLRFELALEEELDKKLHIPLDVRVINDAPLVLFIMCWPKRFSCLTGIWIADQALKAWFGESILISDTFYRNIWRKSKMPRFNPDIVARFIGEIRKTLNRLKKPKTTFPGSIFGKP